MQQVSSNLTLPLRIFFPTFWLVFFGLLTFSAWIVSPEKGGVLSNWDIRLGITVFFLTGAGLLYFTLLKLKRVEMDHEFIFATNYFKSVRYPWSSVEKLVQQQFLSFPIVYIHLKTPGSFGRRIVFLGSRSRWRIFLEEYPEIASRVVVL
ncbi:MAG: hypothetical protein IPL49_01685 [Saprospirales bacterium]|nr:hypothetical protein [Saprospirales bacterium]MBK8489629.1 hypothetical protein [Saprospirales bacterium]